MKFDWYQASIPETKPQAVMEAICKAEYFGSWQEAIPLKGYHTGAQFVVGDQVLCRISHGGQNEQYGPNILSSGSAAPQLAQVLRRDFPAHRVSRVDACEDFHHRQAYDVLRARALVVAKARRVQVREIVKPLPESDDGRTLYLGCSSTTEARLYEKGKQLGRGDEWVRAEIQVRPQKKIKDLAAHISPLDVWALAKWSHLLAVQLGNADLKRIHPQIYQQADHDRAYRFLLKQYGKVLRQMNETHGSWETVGAQIGYDLAQLQDESVLEPPRPA